jgi:hypothetical protein
MRVEKDSYGLGSKNRYILLLLPPSHDSRRNSENAKTKEQSNYRVLLGMSLGFRL